MSLWMRALKPFKLRANQLAAGDLFRVKDGDVRNLIAFRFAELVDAETQTPKAPAEATTTPSRQPAKSAPAKSDAGSQKPLASLTVAELRALAKQLRIDIRADNKKAELVSEIRRSPRYLRRDMRAAK